MTVDQAHTERTGRVTRHRVSFTTSTRGRKHIRPGHHGGDATSPPPGRVPRVSRLLALAIHFERLVKEGVVSDYAELARLGYVTRARVSQVMALRYLAPDIQEAILSLPRTLKGRDPIRERMVRPIAMEPGWSKQRAQWCRLVKQVGIESKSPVDQQMRSSAS